MNIMFNFGVEWYVIIVVKLLIGEIFDVMVVGFCFRIFEIIFEIKSGINCQICC